MQSRLRDERGNIYVEALIAVAVLAIGLLPIFGGWTLTAGAQSQAGRKQTALAAARSYIEPIHALSADDWDSLPASQSITDPAYPGYNITRTAAPRSGVAGLKDVRVTVTWIERSGLEQSLSLATSVARRP